MIIEVGILVEKLKHSEEKQLMEPHQRVFLQEYSGIAFGSSRRGNQDALPRHLKLYSPGKFNLASVNFLYAWHQL